MKEKEIEISELWKKIVASGKESVSSREDGYEVIELKKTNLTTLTLGAKNTRIVALSRHKTSKHLVEVTVNSKVDLGPLFSNSEKVARDDSVVVTTDHICMRYDKDHFFENVNAKNLNVGDYVSVYDKTNRREYRGEIIKIADLGPTKDWVYDLEVEDRSHAFYANSICCHNSQFVNIECVARDLLKSGIGNGTDISKWSDDHKLKLWHKVEDFVENEVNVFVQDLIKDYCHTEHPEVLRYSLEYISAGGIYESKKHYATRKVIAEGPELIDKIKYSGIELKKASVPTQVKRILKAIYEGILLHGWNENDFVSYVNSIWDDFKRMTIDEISFWKGYSSSRESISFLQMQKGSTAVASASTYYNQIIEKLGLGKKYDQILLGQKVRFCYIKPTNEYRIPYIAFPDGQWPKEFNDLFEIDYETMFDKLVIGSLKGFFDATKFSKIDPSKQVEFDVFSL